MELKLPDIIGSKRDLILASRQIEQTLNDRLQDEVRERFGAKKVGSKAGQQALSALLELNKIMDDTDNLKRLLQNLEAVKQYAPRVRIAFSQEPDQEMFQRLVRWFRAEIHPSVLLQISVQPTLGGGFVLQTNARRYDMSLRTHILASTPKFIEVMRRSYGKEAAQPAPEAATMQPTQPGAAA